MDYKKNEKYFRPIKYSGAIILIVIGAFFFLGGMSGSAGLVMLGLLLIAGGIALIVWKNKGIVTDAIESIVSGETDKPHVTRITIVLIADELMIDQIAAQCRKLIPVLAVKILDEGTSIQREFSLIKVYAADRNARDEVIQMANIFRAKIIDVSRETLTVAIFGDKEKTAALTGMLADFGILEIAKTGTIAIERGRSTIYDDNKLKEEYNYGKNVL